MAEWWLIPETCQVDGWIQTLTKFEEQNSELQSLPAGPKVWEISPIRNQKKANRAKPCESLELTQQKRTKTNGKPKELRVYGPLFSRPVHSWNWHQFQMPKVVNIVKAQLVDFLH